MLLTSSFVIVLRVSDVSKNGEVTFQSEEMGADLDYNNLTKHLGSQSRNGGKQMRWGLRLSEEKFK
jgi:hypothetical protein